MMEPYFYNVNTSIPSLGIVPGTTWRIQPPDQASPVLYKQEVRFFSGFYCLLINEQYCSIEIISKRRLFRMIKTGRP